MVIDKLCTFSLMTVACQIGRDIPLDGGWIKIHCGGTCPIVLNKVCYQYIWGLNNDMGRPSKPPVSKMDKETDDPFLRCGNYDPFRLWLAVKTRETALGAALETPSTTIL